MKVAELRAIVKAHGVKGYSKMNKAELEALVQGLGTVDEYLEWSRKTTPGDGMMICGFKYWVALAAGMRCISENDAIYVIGRIANVETFADFINDARTKSVINKMPPVFQIRHEGCKGIVVPYPIDWVPELKGKDLIIPESARKFASTDWANAPLGICNYLKRKAQWVALNPQFIASLNFENPNAMVPIVDYWFEELRASLNDIAKAQEFHGILSSINGPDGEVNSNLVNVLRNSSDLIDDFQVRNWRRDQYKKFIEEMKVGKIFVPGEYTYMVCDPAGVINRIYGLDLPELKSGEYWFNNKTCKAGLFRSPLIAPFEAQKVQLTENEFYNSFYRDVVIFNCYDGAWENMGGADFDGDTCACVPDDTDLGKIIVDAIIDPGYVVWEEGLSAKKTIFSWDNLAKFNAEVAKVDRTGVITNFATRALDVKRHLEAAVYFAKKMDCEGIYFFHPEQFSSDDVPKTYIIDGVKVFGLRGLVEVSKDPKTKQIKYSPDGITGFKTFDEVLEIAENFLYKTEYLRLLQGREIDGAKTGVAAEGVSGLDYVDSVKVKFTPHHLITRQGLLKRPSAGFAILNKYVSLSPLGRLHDYVAMRQNEFKDEFENGSDKVALLMTLLSDEERTALNSSIALTNGTTVSLVDYLKSRKLQYGNSLKTIYNSEISEEEKKTSYGLLKENEIRSLEDLADITGFSIEVIAVGCYIAAYAKDGKFYSGLSYGWLLFNDILSVFTRNNKRFELYRLPKNAEDVQIIGGIIYVNGTKYGTIDNVYDTDCLPIQTINGKNYGLVHKIPMTKKPASEPAVLSSSVYKIGMIYGFKYSEVGTRDGWKDAVRTNQFMFDVALDETGRLISSINGCNIGAIKTTGVDLNVFELVGHRVKVTAVDDWTEQTIIGITVTVIA